MIGVRSKILLSTCLSTLFLASPLLAQDNPNATSGGLEEIVVTAQRRSQNMQDVPVTVTAQSAEALKAADIRSTVDLTQVVPGLRANMQAAYFQPFIRGVGGTSALAGNEAAVAIYIDGMYVALKEANNFELSNIERIEVLKGPQGTLFGRNATGGAINIITKVPSNDLTASFDGSYGRFQDVTLNGYISGPITSTLTASLAARYENVGEGYVKNIVTGHDFGIFRSYSAMGKLRWEPVSGLVVTGEMIFSKRKAFDDEQGTPNAAIAPKASRVPGAIISYTPYFISQTFDPYLKYNDKKYILDARYDVGGVKLVSITAYENGDTFNQTDRDRSSAPLQIGNNSGFGRQFSQEWQIQSNNDSKLKWIVGAYYFRNREGYNPLYSLANIPGSGTLADLASVFGRAGSTWAETNSTQYVRSYAGFAEATYALTDRTNITAGFRYTYEKRRLTGMRESVTAPPPGTAFVRTRTATIDTKTHFEKPTWRLAIDHHLTDDVMIYASYNRGFRSGAFNPTLIAA